MGKRKKRRLSSTLTWKTFKGFFRLLSQGILKATPLLFFGLIGFGVFWGIREELYADPGLTIQSVEVVPPGALSSEKILALEKVYLGQNMLRISLKGTAQRIERDAGIRQARVIRQFPKTLRIEVTPRKPFVQIQFHPKGPYYWAGEDGVIVGTDLGRNDSFLLIEAFETKGIKPEMGKDTDLSGFDEAVALVKAFWMHSLGKTEIIDRVRLDHLGNVALVLKNGPELRFGRRPLERIYTLDTVAPLLRGAERGYLVYIELQYQDLIVKKK